MAESFGENGEKDERKVREKWRRERKSYQKMKLVRVLNEVSLG